MIMGNMFVFVVVVFIKNKQKKCDRTCKILIMKSLCLLSVKLYCSHEAA